MKNSHRDAYFDKLLNNQVIVTFYDGRVISGKLIWQGDFDLNNPIKPHCYHIFLDSGFYIAFRKSHIRKIEKRCQ